MARLEGRKFFECFKRGVMAIVTEETLRNRERSKSIRTTLEEIELGRGGLILPDPFSNAIQEGLRHTYTPIFTFVYDLDRASPWFTGDYVLYDKIRHHLEIEGGNIQKSDFYVPFSDARELGVHGYEAMRSELEFVTTEAQFRDAFGISLREFEL
jgi:hypothetical protein